jgi:hypothetical protein
MAGLYDRISSIDDNINVHMLVAGIKGYGTGIWTRAQVLASINSLLKSPLTPAEVVDYDAIADILDGQPNTLSKLGYVNQVEAAMVSGESGVLTDAAWRTALEIS